MEKTLNTDTVMVQRLQIHYVFNDGSHSMDAYVKNRCEGELLKIVDEVCKALNVDLLVEITPIKEGGLTLNYDLSTLPRDTRLALATLIASGFIQYFVTQIPNIGDDS